MNGPNPLVPVMREAVRRGLADPATHTIVRRLARGAADPCAALCELIRKRGTYLDERPEVVATLPAFATTLAGDCDDYATAIATVAMATRREVRWDAAETRTHAHIWAVVDGVALDPMVAGGDPRPYIRSECSWVSYAVEHV